MEVLATFRPEVGCGRWEKPRGCEMETAVPIQTWSADIGGAVLPHPISHIQLFERVKLVV